MNLELLTKQVANISRVIGNYLKSEIKNLKTSDIESKGANDFVTYIDKSSEEKLVSELHKLLPEAGFIAEEGSNYHKADLYNWIIDPLDGTTNFIHNVPLYSISIGLQKGNKIILGVVYEINLQECFYAWDDGGAYLNGHSIKTSNTKLLKDSLLATGFPYHDFSRLEEFINMFQYTLKHTHGVRRLGSAAVDLVYTACGRYDGFFEYGLHPWDVAGGSIIIKEAGGIVTDFNASDNFLFGKEIVASNPNNYDEFIQIIKSFFK